MRYDDRIAPIELYTFCPVRVFSTNELPAQVSSS
jgi:hypothetical protein